MPVLQPIIEKMKEIIPNLPQDWASRVGEKLGVTADLVRSYARGDRGVRNKKMSLEILKAMKEVRDQWYAEINEALNELS